MSCLKLYLFGAPRLKLDDRPIDLPRRKVVALLAYLAVTRKQHRRDTLATLFWPESSQTAARGALRRELYTLTSILGNSWFHSNWESIGISPDADVWTDIATFRTLLAIPADHTHAPNEGCPTCIAALRAAVALYTGDFLTGFTLTDALEFDDWQRFEAESLRREFAGALAKLVQLQQAQGEYVPAIDYARRWLALDPLQEAAHRAIMQLYALTGEDGAAIRQYEECVRFLDTEIGAPPASETTELYNAIRTRRISAGKPVQQHAPLEKNASTTGTVAPLQPTSVVTTTSIPMSPVASTNHHPNQRTADLIPLIGRANEWRQLHAAWHTAQQTGIHCVVITGEAGIGKTRLAEDLLAWVREQGSDGAYARSYAAQGELAYTPVIELLRSEPFQIRLAHLGNEWLPLVARLLPDLLKSRPDLPAPASGMDSWQRHQLFEALARTVRAVPHPLLLVLDDLQWCDRGTLEWLYYLVASWQKSSAQTTDMAPLLLVGTIRTGEAGGEHPLYRFLWELQRDDLLTQIDLTRLNAQETEMLATQVATRQLDPAFVELLQQNTAGNPLFIVETVRAGSKAWEGHGGEQGQLVNDFAEAALPPKVYAMIQTRLAQLSPQAQEIAGLAAAIGRFFSFELLTAASQLAEETLASGLDELWDRHIIREQGRDAYDFSHDQIRDVVYSQIGRARRRLLHRRIAEALETSAAHLLDNINGELATHYEQAGLTKRAIEAYTRAATTAQQVGAYQDGITLIRRGLALLASLPDTVEKQAQELAFCLHLALLQRTAFGYAAAAHGQTLTRARTLCQILNKQESLPHVLMGLYTHTFGRGAIKAAQALAEELLSVAQHTSDRMALEEAHHAMGSNLFTRGEFQAAHTHFQQGLRYYEPHRHQNHIAYFGFNLGCFTRAFDSHLLWMLGQSEQAVQQIEATIAHARALAHPFTLALVLAYGAMLHQFRREPEQVKLLAEEALVICTKHGITYYEVWCTILKAWAKSIEGGNHENLTDIQHSLDRFQATESGLRLPYYLSLLADACLYNGQTDRGLYTLHEAEKIATLYGECWWLAELLRLRGELLLQNGAAPADVESYFAQSITLARRQSAKMLELRATVSLGRLWQQQGRSEEARQRLTELLASLTEGLDTPDRQDAQTLLSHLHHPETI